MATAATNASGRREHRIPSEHRPKQTMFTRQKPAELLAFQRRATKPSQDRSLIGEQDVQCSQRWSVLRETNYGRKEQDRYRGEHCECELQIGTAGARE